MSFPFTDLASAKRRPALVVSPDPFNELHRDLILVAKTSRLTHGEATIRLEEEDFEEGALPKKSIISPTKVFTIHSALVLKKICSLRSQKMEEVLATMRQFFS